MCLCPPTEPTCKGVVVSEEKHVKENQAIGTRDGSPRSLLARWRVRPRSGEMCAGLEEQVRTLENSEVLGLQVRERPELAA